LKADVAFKSLKIKFVTTYTQLILSMKETMHGLVIKQCSFGGNKSDIGGTV